MGTPDFAVPSLRLLCEESAANNWTVVAVCTQPDRRAGRGKKLIASPVKAFAEEQGLTVLQPTSFRKQPEMVEAIRDLAPDLLVVAAYGLILPAAVLAIPQFGAVNVHSSLLPAYRGASPITAALLDGLTETGNSIMLMDKGMDTGPVLAQVRLPIEPDDTTATLSARLADLGAQALVETLPGWLAGDIAPVPQDQLPGEVSSCRLIRKEDGAIDWTLSAVEIERRTRAYAPWPSAFTDVEWRRLQDLAGGSDRGQRIARLCCPDRCRRGRWHRRGPSAAADGSAGRQARHGHQELPQRRAGLCRQLSGVRRDRPRAVVYRSN